jgi:hypothetical protein
VQEWVVVTGCSRCDGGTWPVHEALLNNSHLVRTKDIWINIEKMFAMSMSKYLNGDGLITLRHCWMSLPRFLRAWDISFRPT